LITQEQEIVIEGEILMKMELKTMEKNPCNKDMFFKKLNTADNY
jgi:hypothetical protein